MLRHVLVHSRPMQRLQSRLLKRCPRVYDRGGRQGLINPSPDLWWDRRSHERVDSDRVVKGGNMRLQALPEL